jgi:hypothetical protein
MCVNTGRKLKVMVQRLTEEQLLGLKNPEFNECPKIAASKIPGDTSSTEKKHREVHHQISSYMCDNRFPYKRKQRHTQFCLQRPWLLHLRGLQEDLLPGH